MFLFAAMLVALVANANVVNINSGTTDALRKALGNAASGDTIVMAAGTYVSWLAFDGDKIVGTSGMSFAEKPPYFTCPSGRLGILSSMYTDPDYRRLGIATALLDRVVKEAKDYGCGTIYITASNMGVKLYEAYGFKHNGNFMQLNF